MSEILDIVNLDDQVIGQATRDEVYKKSLCHRIVHVLIFNDEGKMALQKRSQSVSFLPGGWSTAVGGHVMSGENYVQGALREFEEELGVLAGIEFFSKDIFEVNEKLKKFVTVYKTNYNGPFKLNDDVELIDFFSIDEIKEMIDRGESFHPELIFLIKKYF